ncbi:hypothetical protein LXA43DRAFT_894187 [Ganoderma leucocontextum]|nr:hypothetical protein LXA43DRAFT_894187 [Ganoderma leucocontextum]
MLAAALRSVVPPKSPARYTLINLYTTVAQLTRKQWKTGAHPVPQSLAKNADEDEEDWPKPLTEGFEHEHEHEHAEALSQPGVDEPADTRPRSHRPYPMKPEFCPTPREHAAHRDAMKKNFPEGWAPPRKLSREAMDSLRHLHQMDPEAFSTPVLADRFHISPEAVRRILKGRWEPTREQKARMAERERVAREKKGEERRAEERRKHESLQREYVWSKKRRDGFALT